MGLSFFYGEQNGHSGSSTKYSYPGLSGEMLLSNNKFIEDDGAGIRGFLPGFLTCMQTAPSTHTTVMNYPGDAAKKIMFIGFSISSTLSPGMFALDITGPWR